MRKPVCGHGVYRPSVITLFVNGLIALTSARFSKDRQYVYIRSPAVIYML
jgi:hypothetical protein